MERETRATRAGWSARRWARPLPPRRPPRTPPATPASTTGGSDPEFRQPPRHVFPRSTPRTASPRRDPRRTQPRAPRTAACTRTCQPWLDGSAGWLRRFRRPRRRPRRPPWTRHPPSPTTRSPIRHQGSTHRRRRRTPPDAPRTCPAPTKLRQHRRRFRSCPSERIRRFVCRRMVVRRRRRRQSPSPSRRTPGAAAADTPPGAS